MEIFRRTPEEARHKQQGDALAKKVSTWKTIPENIQDELQDHRSIANRVNRRRFLAILGGGSVAAVALAVTKPWENGQDEPTSVANRATPTPEAKIETMAEWHALPAKDRLNRLWNNKKPEIKGLNDFDETVLATADFYVNQVTSKFSAQTLASRTKDIRNDDEFFDIAVQEGNQRNNPNLSLEENKKNFLKETIAFTAPDKKAVYLRTKKLEDNIANSIGLDKDFAEYAAKSNVLLKLLSFQLLHEYGHMDQSQTTKTLDTQVLLPLGRSNITIVSFENLRLNGFLMTNGLYYEQKVLSDEALVDLQAVEFAARTGNDVLEYTHSNYDGPRNILSDLTKYAGVGFPEISRYISGELPFEQFLIKMGGINPSSTLNIDSTENKLARGVGIMTAIGLETNGQLTHDQTIDVINSLFATPAKSSTPTPAPFGPR